MQVKFLDDYLKMKSLIDYYLHTKDEKWYFKDEKCQKYPYLEPYQNNLKCLYTSKMMQSLSKIKLKFH